MIEYSVSGHKLLALDARNSNAQRFRNSRFVHSLCVMHGLDAVLILSNPSLTGADFSAEAYGSGGSALRLSEGGEEALCCSLALVAFADLLGVKPFHSADYSFEAEGIALRAQIHSQMGECKRVSIYREEKTLGTGEALCLGEFI